jgi:hypothetical protein
MKNNILKLIGKGLLLIFILFCLLMVTPRTIGFLFPEKPPIGYHFEKLNYLAVGVGLEKMVDLKPKIPETIEEIKNVEYSYKWIFIAQRMQLNLCLCCYLFMVEVIKVANVPITWFIWLVLRKKDI